MYCVYCETDHFGGALCPGCGREMQRGTLRYSRMGEPLVRVGDIRAAEAGGPERVAPIHRSTREAKEAGRQEGALVRFSYKLIESVFACVMFSVALRVVIFMAQVIDSMMETGGDIKEGISFLKDLQMGLQYYEFAVWGLLAILIFKYRHPAV